MSEPERSPDPDDPTRFAPPGLRHANLELRKPYSSAVGSEPNPHPFAAPDDDRKTFASAGAGKPRDAFAQAIIDAMRAEREAEQVPPRLRRRQRSMAAFKLSVGFAIFGGLSYFALQPPSQSVQGKDLWSALETALYGPADNPRGPLLTVSNRSGLMNEALQLGVRISESIPDRNVVVKGVPANASLTAGVPIHRTEWRIDAREIAETRIIPPAGFVGDMNLTAELLDNDGAVIIASGWQLTWKPTTQTAVASAAAADARAAKIATAPAKPLEATGQVQIEPQHLAMVPPAAAAAKDENQKSGQSLPSTSPVPAPARPNGSDVARGPATGAAEIPTVTRLDVIEKPEPALLMRNGTKLMSDGDISAARLMFEQAAEAGSAAAAFALAETYDPAILRRKTVPHDIALARSWYEKARDRGVSMAEDRLARLAELQQ
ncbi:MAG: hypothetical protein JOY90_16830 [Bradyrhizobium sp.]|uniref:hypothetical protein n=1 Tax=Bradyrhizobium sp. TaxID=376 RepID=UPI001DABE5CC|nr:hypothetical protein [Bradyrhizobium sp.]MBV9562089.1 hypothetical protein [Bradyrhizobium sp.]